jgi:hypothetical protein
VKYIGLAVAGVLLNAHVAEAVPLQIEFHGRITSLGGSYATGESAAADVLGLVEYETSWAAESNGTAILPEGGGGRFFLEWGVIELDQALFHIGWANGLTDQIQFVSAKGGNPALIDLTVFGTSLLLTTPDAVVPTSLSSNEVTSAFGRFEDSNDSNNFARFVVTSLRVVTVSEPTTLWLITVGGFLLALVNGRRKRVRVSDRTRTQY